MAIPASPTGLSDEGSYLLTVRSTHLLQPSTYRLIAINCFPVLVRSTWQDSIVRRERSEWEIVCPETRYELKGALELAEGVNFRGRGVRLGRWEGGWRIRLGKCPETRDELKGL